ncbi:uncharacterized protein LOC117318264 [Pecten maximus]|uniref:uncharacterized protein LOC117318264 n=1 Tax=Pecten maximus TaxID=6579 RepID=UPI0014590513|nr:uncharacterized protein LOC117318264 [Pecten maximus]
MSINAEPTPGSSRHMEEHELSDEDRVRIWGKRMKLSDVTIKLLITHGFDSMEALSQYAPEDLPKQKITIGQAKLLNSAVRKTFSDKTTDIAVCSEETDADTPFNTQPQPQPEMDVAAAGVDQVNQDDVFIQTVLRQLESGQGTRTGSTRNIPATHGAPPPTGKGTACTLSWQDPQIYLKKCCQS